MPREAAGLTEPLPQLPALQGYSPGVGAETPTQESHSLEFNIENPLSPVYVEVLFIIIVPFGIFPHCFLQSCFKLLC